MSQLFPGKWIDLALLLGGGLALFLLLRSTIAPMTSRLAVVQDEVSTNRGFVENRKRGQSYQSLGEIKAELLKFHRAKSNSTYPRIVLASVPRSGNGWVRGLLEITTGLATHSVFNETNSRWDSRTSSFTKRCGWLEDCTLVHERSLTDPVVIKTHFPFATERPLKGERLRQGVSDVSDIGYLLLPVRNPLDNFDAWHRYLLERKRFYEPIRGSEARFEALKAFMKDYAEHHDFWLGQAVPSCIYRYEDLVDDPVAIASLLLKSSNLWNLTQVDELRLLHVANVTKLQSYKSKQNENQLVLVKKQAGTSHDQTNNANNKFDGAVMGYKKHTLQEVEFVLSVYSDLLHRYGYYELYLVWRDVLSGELSPIEASNRAVNAMRETMRRVSRGENPWK